MSGYQIGIGKKDITSQIVGVRFFGYGEVTQVGEGLEQRLFARAFVVRRGTQSWVYVICDLGIMTRLVRRRVEERLKERFGDRYPPERVCLAATHTHSAPGGFSQFFLYNVSILGWSERVTATIVDGIVAAIEEADASLSPGRVGLAVGQLADASVNRMLEAYERNPPEERADYELPFDDRFVQLHFRDADGRLRGLLNWFAVHGTSHDKKNTLVSPDNKGHAAWLVEKELKVVAGFALANHADVSPNRIATPDRRLVGEGATTQESCSIIGRRQAQKALDLVEGPEIPVTGPLLGALSWVDFREAPVTAERSSTGVATRTGPALLGQNFIVGTEDGRGPAWFDEGASRDRLVALVARVTAPLSPEVRALHAPKDPFVLLSRVAWQLVPGILPVQLLVLGCVAWVGVPFELTTMAGRRLRRQVLKELVGLGVTEVVPVSIANAYAGYTATPEEYAVQHYEGASTLFGREQLGAIQTVVDRLVHGVRDGHSVATLEPPPATDPGAVQLDEDRPDAVFGLTWFGDVSSDARPRYRPGETVEVTFWAGHPSSRFLPSYLSVERRVGAEWAPIADDHDFSTQLQYSWFLSTFLKCTCRWTIAQDLPPGTFRIVHHGTWNAGGGRVVEYTGTSRPFEVDHFAPSLYHLTTAPPKELQALRPFCVRRTIQAGEVLIKEGDEDDTLYLIEGGELLISRQGVELDHLGPGELVGEMGLFAPGKRAATVTVTTSGELLALSRAELDRITAGSPAAVRGLERHALDSLARRLRRVDFILGQVGQGVAPPPSPSRNALVGWLRSLIKKPVPPAKRAVDVAAVLARSALFHGVEPALAAKIAQLFEHRAVAPGTFLCTQGAREDELFLLLLGEVDVVVSADDDRELVQYLGVLSPGEAFGLTALVDGRPRMASCVAKEQVDVLVMSRVTFEATVPLDSPEAGALRRAMIRALADQIRRTNERLVAAGWSGLDLPRERAGLESWSPGPG